MVYRRIAVHNQKSRGTNVASATLAEKTRTPPRRFLWWCFLSVGAY
jgi:hypothetical protein